MRTIANEWQATFDAVNSAVWLLDKDQRIIRANKATAVIFNKEPGEVLGKFWLGAWCTGFQDLTRSVRSHA